MNQRVEISFEIEGPDEDWIYDRLADFNYEMRYDSSTSNFKQVTTNM